MSVQEYVPTRTGNTPEAFRRAVQDNLYYVIGKNQQTATQNDYYMALAYTVRDRLIQRWLMTNERYAATDAKQIAYFSAEYLLGRQLMNNLLNEDMIEVAREALSDLGLNLDDLAEHEAEPGLGNGGLGRLAACFLDSLATIEMPAVGYGIRYEYGIFKQRFEQGWQAEQPDDWLYRGNPWEIATPDLAVEVGFGGHTESYVDTKGQHRIRWRSGWRVLGMPYTTLVPGYGTENVNSLRLWSARATESFDLQLFNQGDYARAVEEKVFSENISKVLYPEDTTPQGRMLRLQQQYFFVACSLADIIRTFKTRHTDWSMLPERAAVQMNDTHPTIAVAELMRILLDEEGLTWDNAWGITRRVMGYTCHTLMPEALEVWPVDMFEQLLPRHLEIIYEINAHFLDDVRLRFPGDQGRVARMSIIGESPAKTVRMAHLASVGSHSINGVAALHSELLRTMTLLDFYELWPEKFSNKTNGITPRRFVRLANPGLSALITEHLGDGWLANLDQLSQLEPLAEDAAFRARWRAIKRANKVTLAATVQKQTGIELDTNSVYDVMVKRLHEYKRQHLKILHVITLFNRIKRDPGHGLLPRTVIFGAKAAPGYKMAKLIIRLINGVAEVVNNDADVRGRLKVVYVPNFNVSVAEKIYPAADISEQISMAGKEASGTGNMKFALNGAVTIGTLDGANVEIRELVGADNFFLFGLTTPEVFAAKAAGYDPRTFVDGDHELQQALAAIGSGVFGRGDTTMFQSLLDQLLSSDPFMVMADYRSYIGAQEAAELVYQDEERWTRMSILNAARCGFFTSDRAMRQYCAEIWKTTAVPAR